MENCVVDGKPCMCCALGAPCQKSDVDSDFDDSWQDMREVETRFSSMAGRDE